MFGCGGATWDVNIRIITNPNNGPISRNTPTRFMSLPSNVCGDLHSEFHALPQFPHTMKSNAAPFIATSLRSASLLPVDSFRLA